MSADDLARGIEALDDEEVRAKVAEGDLSAAGDLELTDDEQALLVAAASDEPDVVGFGINTGLLGLGGDALAGHKVTGTPGTTVNKAKTADKAFKAMDAYIKG